jgi:hypothetical protein
MSSVFLDEYTFPGYRDRKVQEENRAPITGRISVYGFTTMTGHGA